MSSGRQAMSLSSVRVVIRCPLQSRRQALGSLRMRRAQVSSPSSTARLDPCPPGNTADKGAILFLSKTSNPALGPTFERVSAADNVAEIGGFVFHEARAGFFSPRNATFARSREGGPVAFLGRGREARCCKSGRLRSSALGRIHSSSRVRSSSPLPSPLPSASARVPQGANTTAQAAAIPCAGCDDLAHPEGARATNYGDFEATYPQVRGMFPGAPSFRICTLSGSLSDRPPLFLSGPALQQA